MIFSGLSIINKNRPVYIALEQSKIAAVSESLNTSAWKPIIFFENAIVFPGLINSHDHLEFNLFPPLKNRFYGNYVEWGDDILKTKQSTIKAVQKVPLDMRVKWGLYKNLLNGFTTVVHHGVKLPTSNLIQIHQHCQSLHSVKLEKFWRLKLNNFFFAKKPVAMHIGEGTDNGAHNEIDKLIQWNLFGRKLIGIHGIAMDKQQADAFDALVWCPASNFFLNNKTANVDNLKMHTNIIFGTDSTLSAPWHLQEHLQIAKNNSQFTEEELLNLFTVNAAKAWQLSSTGKIEAGYDADMVIIKNNKGSNFHFTEFKTEDILLIVQQGNIRLFDSSMQQQVVATSKSFNKFSKIEVNSTIKFVQGNLPALMKQIQQIYPAANFHVQS